MREPKQFPPSHTDVVYFFCAQQHTAICGVAARVRTQPYKVKVLADMVADPNFEDRLQHAIVDPTTEDVHKFISAILPLINTDLHR